MSNPAYDESALRDEILDPDKGFVVLRSVFTPEEVDAYREECNKFLETGARRHTRVTCRNLPDYVHPRSHDKTARTYRIYQFLHNQHSPATQSFLDKGFALRNRIEQTWMNDPRYKAERERLMEYIIVTKYVANTGMLKRHKDYEGDCPFPLLQSMVLLSRDPEDFTKGDFLLYTKSGRVLSLARDIALKKGDLLMFDKSLDHEVETTGPGTETDIGRWTVLIGARAKPDKGMSRLLKSTLYREPLYPYSEPVIGVLRRLGALQ